MLDKIEGYVYILGDDINTDDIVPSHTLTMRDPHEIAKCTLEFIDPNFVKNVNNGNIIVAGENFGTGSSREEAVNVFKILGIKAIISKSFARIYFRNLINVGIPAITLDWDDTSFSKGDNLEISLQEGIISNKSKNLKKNFVKLPKFLTNILEEGGIINQLKKELLDRKMKIRLNEAKLITSSQTIPKQPIIKEKQIEGQIFEVNNKFLEKKAIDVLCSFLDNNINKFKYWNGFKRDIDIQIEKNSPDAHQAFDENIDKWIKVLTEKNMAKKDKRGQNLAVYKLDKWDFKNAVKVLSG